MTAVPRASARGDTVWIDFDPQAAANRPGGVRPPRAVASLTLITFCAKITTMILIIDIDPHSNAGRAKAIAGPVAKQLRENGVTDGISANPPKR